MTAVELALIVGAFLFVLVAGGLWARGFDEREDARSRNQARPWR